MSAEIKQATDKGLITYNVAGQEVKLSFDIVKKFF